MIRLLFLFFLYCAPMEAVPSIFDGLSALQANPEAKQLPLPDPYTLQPHWWHYYDVEEPELTQRVEGSIRHLQMLYASLTAEEQLASLPFINSFNSSLVALPEAKQEQIKNASYPKNFPKSYTLEQQLQLNQQWRKLQIDTKKDQGDFEELKNRIAKVHKNIDTLFAAYLRGSSKPTSARLIAGLEIMAQRAALGIAEENRRLLQAEIESQQKALELLGNELRVARGALDVSQYDEAKLENDIKLSQSHFEKKQREIVSAEASAISVRGSSLQERANKQLLAQRAIQSSAEEAQAWVNLAFQSLKYTLIMHINQRFRVENSEMHDRLKEWKEHLNSVLRQASEWEKLTLQEQDRIRHDQGMLGASDGDIVLINEARRRVTTETLALLQRLEENMTHVQWLIQQLEHSLRASSNFMARWWGDFNDSIETIWQGIVRKLNISLFKVYEIPITLLTLLRIALILFLSVLISRTLRFSIEALGKFRDKEPTYYTIGRLVHYLIFLIAGIAVLCSIGLDFSHVLILLGALVFGIGFGLQSVATNFLCGLRILFEGKIKIGDYIELKSGRYGKVTEIHVHNTVICTSDGVEIVIPNSELLSEPLVNWTMNNDHRRLQIPFSTAYEVDKELVRKVVSEAAKHVPCTLKTSEHGEPQVWLVKFGDHSLDFELAVWVNYKTKSYTESKEADYLWAIETALRENHIELPIPQQVMYLKNTPARESWGAPV